MTETTVPMAAHGDSQCYRCSCWRWEIDLAPRISDCEWVHICTSPGDYPPGDNVHDCEGFYAIKETTNPIDHDDPALRDVQPLDAGACEPAEGSRLVQTESEAGS